ncbi:hypothetical protein RCL_jg15364.t1 [Rhizophagus clarus]|uniref:Uncharacterized protein n=1 Tax=Rhizophagus clarus TaxID=94130 RepID=A0A8H3QBD3_9GLOM|nr:hypothetical protein RCL_jg15364.t1 [Rhizophagus clarus]
MVIILLDTSRRTLKGKWRESSGHFGTAPERNPLDTLRRPLEGKWRESLEYFGILQEGKLRDSGLLNSRFDSTQGIYLNV